MSELFNSISALTVFLIITGIGTLLLLNLFKDRLDLPAENGTKAPVK